MVRSRFAYSRLPKMLFLVIQSGQNARRRTAFEWGEMNCKKRFKKSKNFMGGSEERSSGLSLQNKK